MKRQENLVVLDVNSSKVEQQLQALLKLRISTLDWIIHVLVNWIVEHTSIHLPPNTDTYCCERVYKSVGSTVVLNLQPTIQSPGEDLVSAATHSKVKGHLEGTRADEFW